MPRFLPVMPLDKDQVKTCEVCEDAPATAMFSVTKASVAICPDCAESVLPRVTAVACHKSITDGNRIMNLESVTRTMMLSFYRELLRNEYDPFYGATGGSP